MTLKLILGALLSAVAVGLAALATLGGGKGSDIPFVGVQRHGASSSLVVVLHAFGNSAADMAHVQSAVQEKFPDADLLVPSYLSSTFANTDPRQLATDLDRRIEDLFRVSKSQGRPYQKIILAGHSIGALVVRRAYLYGLGYRSDYHDPEQRALSPEGPPREWAAAVERIVLLASINRGWELEMLDNRSPINQVRLWLGTSLALATGTGKLFLSVQRGAPFVSNLRIDWIRAVRRAPGSIAPVVQLLGGGDDLVTPGDDLDTITAPNFVFVRVDGADHINIVEMPQANPSPEAALRRALFSQALSEGVERLRETYKSNQDLLKADPRVRHVIFIKHGIRDMADWSSPLRTALESADGTVRIVNQKYPYFSMLSFLLLWDRQRQVRHFVDEYAQVLAEYPNADRISYIGHSFGTYIVASALEDYASVRLHKLYFAGSVVRRDFPWDRVTSKFDYVRNDCAASDWVVAIFPRAFEQLRTIPGLGGSTYLDVGSAGINGFTADVATRLETKYLAGGHGAAFDFSRGDNNLRSIVAYMTSPEPGTVAAPAGLVSAVPAWIRLAGQFAWLLCLAIAAMVLRGAYAVWVATCGSRWRWLLLLAYATSAAFLLNTV